jgi:ABC-type polysaccharide/polyol phosphate export permease
MERISTAGTAWSFPRSARGRLGFRRYAEVVETLARRSLKTKYRGSVLGIYWSLSNPIVMTLVYSAIFGSAFAASYKNSIFLYALSCFCGLALMNFFLQSSSQALPSIVGNGALLNKIRLPVSVFPVSTIAANTFQLLIGVVPFLAIITLASSKSLLNVVALVIPVVSLIMVTAAFGLITSALYVYFRDFQYIYELFGFMLFLTTPIFYPIELVPAQIRPFMVVNPLAAMISSVRDIALSGGPPHLSLLVFSFASGLASLLVGVAIFLCVKGDFMDLL